MNEVKIMTEFDFLPVTELGGIDPDGFIAYFQQHKPGIEHALRTNGAIKFKGIEIDSIETFQKIVDSISTKFMNYIDGSSPRTKLSDKVYTSTEYDKSQRITMHNELSYSSKWPNKLFFSCLKPAETGGQTLLADSREILQKMNKGIVDEIRQRGITYIRNLHGGVGIGSCWQKTFETSDKKQVEAYCRSYAMEFEWSGNDGLRLKQPSKGIIDHRETKEEVWFNQVDQFHPYQLGEKMYNAMIEIYDTPEEFPMYVSFGDGKPISEDIIKEILDTVEAITVAPSWEKNELLIVDNELMSHGRNPYTGERKVLVSMSE